MTTPTGTIGLSDVNAELGFSPTALIDMNASAVRTLAGVGGSGTVISMDNLRGKSNRVAIPLTISSSTYNYNVYTAATANPAYNAGKSDVTVTINPGVTVGSTSTGTYAFSIPSSFNPGDTITVVNNGTVLGAGGAGGAGGNWASPPGGGNPQFPYASRWTPGYSGGSGGTAVYAARPVVFTNNGTLAGGGGGGGGGGVAARTSYYPDGTPATAHNIGGGGGGGAGYNAGPGGAGGNANGGNQISFSGNPGGSGSSNSGGGGGSPRYPDPSNNGGNGGTGGGRGASGSSGNPGSYIPPGGASPGGSGGGAGAYISGAPYITWPATGTRLGPSS